MFETRLLYRLSWLIIFVFILSPSLYMVSLLQQKSFTSHLVHPSSIVNWAFYGM